MDIKTTHNYPPIPTRNFDWSCYDADTFDADWDGERYVTTCPIGNGETEEEAIVDFVRQLILISDVGEERNLA